MLAVVEGGRGPRPVAAERFAEQRRVVVDPEFAAGVGVVGDDRFVVAALFDRDQRRTDRPETMRSRRRPVGATRPWGAARTNRGPAAGRARCRRASGRDIPGRRTARSRRGPAPRSAASPSSSRCVRCSSSTAMRSGDQRKSNVGIMSPENSTRRMPSPANSTAPHQQQGADGPGRARDAGHRKEPDGNRHETGDREDEIDQQPRAGIEPLLQGELHEHEPQGGERQGREREPHAARRASVSPRVSETEAPKIRRLP